MKTKFTIILVLSPIALNFAYNQFREFNSLGFVKNFFIKSTVTILLFLILLLIGKAIDNIFQLNSTTFSIVIYIMTFYVINYYFMLFFKSFPTRNIFLIYNIFLFLILMIKSKSSIKFIVSSILLFILMNITLEHLNLYNLLIFNDHISYDEINMWKPRSEVISNENIYEIYNQKIGGGTMSFGLLVHFSFVFLEYIFHFSNGYIFSQVIPNVVFLLFSYFIFENFNINFYTLVGYLTIIFIFLTSDWFTYFLINSHLGETFSTFYFGVLFYYLIKTSTNITQYTIGLFYLSNLIYTKRFILGLVLISLVHLIYQNREKLFTKLYIVLSAFSPILINYYFLDVPLLWVVENEPTNAIYYEGPTYNLSAIPNIIKQFLMDRPVSYFIFITILLIIYNLKKLENFEVIAISLLSVNTLILFLYFVFISTLDSAWGDAYRYFLNPVYILFFIFLEMLNKINQKIK